MISVPNPLSTRFNNINLPDNTFIAHMATPKRVENVEDVVSVGDKVTVKFLGTDEKGRINLSRKDALKEE